MSREKFDKDESNQIDAGTSLLAEQFQSAPQHLGTIESTTKASRGYSEAYLENDALVFRATPSGERVAAAPKTVTTDAIEVKQPIEKTKGSDGRTEYIISAGPNPSENARNLQQAIKRAIAEGGGTITAMPGDYKGHVHIPSEATNLVIQSAQVGGRRAQFDMSGASPTAENRAVFHVHGGKNIEIAGFGIKNYKSTETNPFGPPIGILIEGPSSNIKLKNMDIGFMGFERPGLLANSRIGSQPILINGAADGSAGSVSGIRIESCKIHDVLLGHHEAINAKGRVFDIRISNNEFKNLNNIGIAIEGLSGGRRPERFEISNNRFENVGIARNHTYPVNDRSAAGVQLDGAAHGSVRGNIFIDGMHGVIAEREQPSALPTANVEVTGNTFVRMQEAAIYLNSEHQRSSIAIDGFRYGNNVYQMNNRNFAQDATGISGVVYMGGDRKLP